METCTGCTMTSLCLVDPDFRRGRPFTRFPQPDGTYDYCNLLRDNGKRQQTLQKHYHRPLPSPTQQAAPQQADTPLPQLHEPKNEDSRNHNAAELPAAA